VWFAPFCALSSLGQGVDFGEFLGRRLPARRTDIGAYLLGTGRAGDHRRFGRLGGQAPDRYVEDGQTACRGKDSSPSMTSKVLSRSTDCTFHASMRLPGGADCPRRYLPVRSPLARG
jgi:hypothetical protein